MEKPIEKQAQPQKPTMIKRRNPQFNEDDVAMIQRHFEETKKF